MKRYTLTQKVRYISIIQGTVYELYSKHVSVIGKTVLGVDYDLFIKSQVHCWLCSYVFVNFFTSICVFLSRTFTNHRTAGEWGEHFFNSSLPLPPASQTLRH